MLKKIASGLLSIMILAGLMVTTMAQDLYQYPNIVADYECANNLSYWEVENATKSLSQDVYHSGNSSMKFSIQSLGATNWIFKNLLGVSPLEHNVTYTYSFWMKASDYKFTVIRPYFYYYYDATYGVVDPNANITIANTKEWQYVTGTITMNLTAFNAVSGAVMKKMYFNVMARGATAGSSVDVLIDQVSLRKTPTATEGKVNLIKTSRIVNKLDITKNDGIKFIFDAPYVGDKIFTPRINGTALVAGTYTTSINTSRTELSVVFNQPVDASTITSCDYQLLTDFWNRSISSTVISNGFENKISDYECDTLTPWGMDYMTKATDTIEKHSGTNSLKLTTTSLQNAANLFKYQFTGAYPMQSGDYQYSFWMKTSDAGKIPFIRPNVRYYYTNPTLASTAVDGVNQAVASTTDWQYITGTYTANFSAFPTGATPTEMYFAIAARGTTAVPMTIWIDQFSLKRIPTSNENLTSCVRINPIINNSQITGVKALFGGYNLNDTTVLASTLNVNGVQMQAGDYSITNTKDYVDTTTVLTVNFTSPVSDLSSIEIVGLSDIWSRSIAARSKDLFNAVYNYSYLNNGNWVSFSQIGELSGNKTIKVVANITNGGLYSYSPNLLVGSYEDMKLIGVGTSEASLIANDGTSSVMEVQMTTDISALTNVKTFLWEFPSQKPLQ